MDYIEDWVDRAMSCFYRDRDKDDPGKAHVHDDVIFAPPAPLDPAKVDKDFECLVKELGLSEEKQQEMHDYSMEKKMSLLVSQHCLQTEDASHFIGFLKNLQQSFVIDSNTIRQLQDLVISLRTQNFSYLESFLSASGLKLLTELLNQCHQQYTLEQPALFFLYALRALLNSPNGRAAVLHDEQHVLVSIARAVDFRDFKCKIVAIEILSGLCFIPDEGHIQVLRAITEVSAVLGERTRFQTLVADLHRNYSTDRDTDRVRTAIFGLINALLRTGAAENCAVYRQHLRSELLMLGMSTTLEQCRGTASQRLEDHIDLFEMMRKEDEISLAGSCTSSDISSSSESSSPIDFESVVGMAESLHLKLKHSLALPHFHSLLQHLFMVPSDDQHVPLWRLFDLILQHLTLQTTVNGMTDVNSPIQNHVDMSEILARLQNHCDYERIAKELEKAKEEMDLERTRILELENRLADFSDGRAGSRISLASTSASSSPSDPCPSPPLLPPICPPAPPPPPPPINGLLGNGGPPKDALKNVPEPVGNMKTLNWHRLTSEKTKGTVWDGIDDEKIYKQLDLTELNGSFAASSSHKDEDTDTLYGTINRRPQQANITVIDPRRYQNCTIMLSKLKLSHKEIKQAMMSMDEKCKLPKDMIEQMLKFMPTKEELSQINESVQKHGSPTVLALADRYMYEISSIPRFEQRLRCLHIIRSFHDRVETLVPFIQVVLKATSSIQQNKRFRQILTIILAVGNYLNYGKRNGNAYGFEIASINKLSDVKNALRNDRNLLHFLVQFIEKKYPDLTKFKKDLATVTEAARFSQSETAAEIRNLEESLLIVRKELNLLESSELPEHIPMENDRFTQVAKGFIEKATGEYHNLDKMFREMKNKFSECAKYFCYSPSGGAPIPEEFFSVINKFLITFNEYHHQLWAEVEEEEKIKRQTIARSFLAKKSTTRRKENHKERDFEQLISALQSGDIFKEELSRLRTSFRPKKGIKS